MPRPVRHVIAFVALLVPAVAEAAGAEEWELGVAANLARVSADGRNPLGFGVGLDGLYGFDDGWAARLSVDMAWHGVEADAAKMLPSGTVRSASAFAGVTYTVDVLRLLPFVEAAIGVLDIGGDVNAARRSLGFEVGLGAQYLVTRNVGLGLGARYRYLPVDLGGTSIDQTPTLFVLGLRLSRLFD